MESAVSSGHIFKLDRFVVPNSARAEFLPRVMSIMDLLKSQPGFIQSLVFEQPASNNAFVLVTVAEWRDKQATEGARSAVMSMQKATGFNPQETMTRLGVQADMGFYDAVNA